MKAQEREAKRSLTAPELEAEIRQSREKLFRLRFKHRASRQGSSPVKNPLEIRTLRRHVARLETWLRDRRVAASGKEGR